MRGVKSGRRYRRPPMQSMHSPWGSGNRQPYRSIQLKRVYRRQAVKTRHCLRGKATITIGQNGLIGFTNGTSLSSPFMAGLVASLWSANPNLSRAEVIDIVKRSADRYNRPDSVYGYGIPDFGKALKEVLGSLEPHKKRVVEREFSITRSAKERFEVLLTEAELSPDAYRINLVDESGNLIAEYRFEEGQLTLPVQREVLQKNKYLHFIFMSPFTQKTIRFRL